VAIRNKDSSTGIVFAAKWGIKLNDINLLKLLLGKIIWNNLPRRM
jgi:hypothetical protein